MVIRALGLVNAGRRELEIEKAEEIAARRMAIEAAMLHLDDSNKRASIDEKTLQALRNAYRDRLKHVEAGGGESGCPDAIPAHADIVAQLLAIERDKMINLFREGHLKDEPRRRIERDLDLREAELANLNLLDEAQS